MYFDVSDWSRIELTGEERLSFLQSFCTNDLRALHPGQMCEAFLPNVKGRIVGHVLIVGEPERLMLISVPGTEAAISEHLEKYLLGSDTTIRGVSQATRMLCVRDETILSNNEVPVPDDGQAICFATADGITLTSVHVPVMTARSVFIYGPAAGIASLEETLRGCSATCGTAEQFHVQRIEAGFPFVGIDINEEMLVQEAARTPQAVSFEKGCYLGQEPIARLDAMGHTNKELRGFWIQAAKIASGATVLVDGQNVGKLTSSAAREDGTSVALGVIRTRHASPGTQVQVTTNNEEVQAQVFWPHLDSGA